MIVPALHEPEEPASEWLGESLDKSKVGARLLSNFNPLATSMKVFIAKLFWLVLIYCGVMDETKDLKNGNTSSSQSGVAAVRLLPVPRCKFCNVTSENGFGIVSEVCESADILMACSALMIFRTE